MDGMIRGTSIFDGSFWRSAFAKGSIQLYVVQLHFATKFGLRWLVSAVPQDICYGPQYRKAKKHFSARIAFVCS